MYRVSAQHFLTGKKVVCVKQPVGKSLLFFRLQIQQLHRPRDLGSLAVKVGSDELPESAEVRSAYCWSLLLVQISDA